MATDTETLTFDVEGMTCASCALRIERVLGKQEGVAEAVVNLAGAEAVVTLDGPADPEQLTEAISRIGYQLALMADDEPRPDLAARYSDDARYQLRRVVGAASLTVPVMLLATLGPDATWNHVVQWVLTTPVVFLFGAQFHRAALTRLRSFSANMDTLVSLGTTVAYLYSVWATFAGEAPFFETAGIITTLILLGRFFEARAKGNASAAITKLLELGAKEARLITPDGEQTIPIDQLRPGDVFVVRPGEKVATDGVIVEGRSAFDESMLTGESEPAERIPGDTVYGATLNQHGLVKVRAEAVGSETALAHIVRLVEDAQASKAPIQKLADRVSGVFVPVVIGVAALTLTLWLLVSGDVAAGLRASVAVLIIACPCALGLATPTAIMVGSGRAAQFGLVFKNAEVFERAEGLDTVIFDKTGTLTRGAMTLAAYVSEEETFLARVAAVEAASEHAIGRAVALGAEERDVDYRPVTDVEGVPGLGIRGRVDGVEVLIGKAKFLADNGLAVIDDHTTAMEAWESEGMTAFVAGWDGESRGALAVADTVRATSQPAVEALHNRGIEVGLITGDNARTAESIGAELGIDQVMADVLPAQKADEVERLQSAGRKVAFVGDGVNDAPALAVSDLGMAIGTGTDVAIETGDVILMSGDPKLVPTALEISGATLRTIRQNLFWAFFYNVAAIPLAAFGLLNPMIAAAAMAFSSVSVVTNSLRLRRFEPS